MHIRVMRINAGSFKTATVGSLIRITFLSTCAFSLVVWTGLKIGTTIAGKVSTTISGKVSTTIAGKVSTTIAGKVSTTIAGKVWTTIAGNVWTTIASKVSTTIASKVSTTIASKVSANQKHHLIPLQMSVHVTTFPPQIKTA